MDEQNLERKIVRFGCATEKQSAPGAKNLLISSLQGFFDPLLKGFLSVIRNVKRHESKVKKRQALLIALIDSDGEISSSLRREGAD